MPSRNPLTGKSMKKVFFPCVFFFFILSFSLFPQTSNGEKQKELDNAGNAGVTDSVNKSLKEERKLPGSFHKINLGMDIEKVKEELKIDGDFDYRGARDISILPTENRSLIETQGVFFIKRGWFQFYKDKLYSIIIKMDTDNIDYYSIYTKLTEKYGEPDFINPKKALWEDENVQLVLERPLTIKYIDAVVFKELLDKSSTEKAFSTTLRENFIDEF